MNTGYSNWPLTTKLGIKQGFRIRAIGEPDYYWNLLGALPPGVSVRKRKSSTPLDLVHLFVKRVADLERRLPPLRNEIVSNGAIWVSWPKQSSGVSTELKESIVTEIGAAAGLG